MDVVVVLCPFCDRRRDRRGRGRGLGRRAWWVVIVVIVVPGWGLGRGGHVRRRGCLAGRGFTFGVARPDRRSDSDQLVTVSSN